MNNPPAKPAGPPLVLFSWDGSELPLRLLLQDATPAFETVLFEIGRAHV